MFGTDNRAGVTGTLHRISAMRNRRGGIVGLTCRVGRAVSGHMDMLRDLVESECTGWCRQPAATCHVTRSSTCACACGAACMDGVAPHLDELIGPL